MAAICATPIKGTAIRVVKVDACGVPTTGSDMVFTTSGFISVAMEPQYEDGQEFFEKNADGDACVNQKDDPVLKRLQLTIEFCEVDPDLATYVLSARELLDGSSDTMGFALAEGKPTNHFSLECWQRVAGSGACDASGSQRYIYNAWPNVGHVKMGTYTIENGRASFTVTAETDAASTDWEDGPGTGTSWMPGTEVIADDEHWVWAITTTTPPTGVCGPQALS